MNETIKEYVQDNEEERCETARRQAVRPSLQRKNPEVQERSNETDRGSEGELIFLSSFPFLFGSLIE